MPKAQLTDILVEPRSEPPSEPSDRLVMATMWNGPFTLAQLAPGEDEPTPAEVEDVATKLIPANGGVKPVVRTVTCPRQWSPFCLDSTSVEYDDEPCGEMEAAIVLPADWAVVDDDYEPVCSFCLDREEALALMASRALAGQLMRGEQ